jgi:hypothetical protein
VAGRHRQPGSGAWSKAWAYTFILGYILVMVWGCWTLLVDPDIRPAPKPLQIDAPPAEPFVAVTPTPAPVDKAPVPAKVRYKSCEEVAELKKLPLLKGQPGYRKGLDTDGDGRACENYY